MRWIEDHTEYERIRLLSRDCVHIDSGRQPVDKTTLYFCDLTAMTKSFPPLLKDLLSRSGDGSCVYMVLDPDPQYFWHDRLGGYPAFEFGTADAADDYSKFLNKPFGANRGGNMVDMWYSYVIFPPSQRWFVHTVRSDRDDTGHLWVPLDWKEDLTSKFPFLRDSPSSDP